jgi:hypothetical protein
MIVHDDMQADRPGVIYNQRKNVPRPLTLALGTCAHYVLRDFGIDSPILVRVWQADRIEPKTLELIEEEFVVFTPHAMRGVISCFRSKPVSACNNVLVSSWGKNPRAAGRPASAGDGG